MMSSRERNTGSREEGAPCEAVAKYMIKLSHSVTWSQTKMLIELVTLRENFEKDLEG